MSSQSLSNFSGEDAELWGGSTAEEGEGSSDMARFEDEASEPQERARFRLGSAGVEGELSGELSLEIAGEGRLFMKQRA